MPPAEQEAGHRQPLEQMLALEPFLELGLAAGAAVVEDREDAKVRSLLAHFAATTMISTL